MDRSTFLSDYVQKILEAGKQVTFTDQESLLSGDLTIDCDALEPLLAGALLSIEDFFDTVTRIAKHRLFADCHSTLGSRERLPKEYEAYLQWTSNAQLFFYVHRLLRSNSRVDELLATLLLTSTIERSLSDLFRIRGKKVPLLLRDLLCTSELDSMCGEQYMRLFRVLMGPVTSLNVRNVAWHGFAAAGELNPQYAHTLLVLTASVGKRLVESGLASQVKHRGFKSLIELEVASSTACDSATAARVPLMDEHKLRKVFENSRFIPLCMRSIWIGALQIAFSECTCNQEDDGCNSHASALVLLIPALEHVLRIRFCEANRCPERMQTAITNTLYTTLDDILATRLSDRFCDGCEHTSNKLWLDLGQSRMQMLLDLYVYPDGRRLRDRLSHGDVNLLAVDRALVMHVFSIAAYACMEPERDLADDPLCPDQLRHQILSYDSVYHPISICRRNLIDLERSLNSLFVLNHDASSFQLDEQVEQLLLRLHTLHADAADTLLDDCRTRLTRGLLYTWPSSVSVPSWMALVDACTPDVHVRDQLAIELRIWIKCTLVLRNTAAQLLQTATERVQRQKELDLRSRVRGNLQRLINFLPLFRYAVTSIVSMFFFRVARLTSQFARGCTFESALLFDTLRADLTRATKHGTKLLRLVETLASITAANVNRWTDAEQHVRNNLVSHLYEQYALCVL